MVRRKPAGQYQPGVADGRLDLQRATERACGVVGLRTVVIREDMVVTAIAKNRTAAFSDIRRRLHPTRRLRIEIAQGLQLSILRFREDLNPRGGPPYPSRCALACVTFLPPALPGRTG